MVFQDESGTGSIAKEPYFVLAGVIVHADKQWKAIEKHLVALMDKHCPLPWDDRPLNFCFHGTELYSGGKVFTREKFPKEQRWEILDQLVAIPAKFDLPVVMTFVKRADYPDLVTCYRGCHIESASVVEAYMRLQPDKEEVASIICEDLPEVRSWVQWVQRFQQHDMHRSDLHADERDRLWLTRVIGQPHFEGKSPFSPLQVADVCAFAMAANLMKKPDHRRFFDPIVPMIIDRHYPRPGGYVPAELPV